MATNFDIWIEGAPPTVEPEVPFRVFLNYTGPTAGLPSIVDFLAFWDKDEPFGGFPNYGGLVDPSYSPPSFRLRGPGQPFAVQKVDLEAGAVVLGQFEGDTDWWTWLTEGEATWRIIVREGFVPTVEADDAVYEFASVKPAVELPELDTAVPSSRMDAAPPRRSLVTAPAGRTQFETAVPPAELVTAPPLSSLTTKPKR